MASQSTMPLCVLISLLHLTLENPVPIRLCTGFLDLCTAYHSTPSVNLDAENTKEKKKRNNSS